MCQGEASLPPPHPPPFARQNDHHQLDASHEHARSHNDAMKRQIEEGHDVGRAAEERLAAERHEVREKGKRTEKRSGGEGRKEKGDRQPLQKRCPPKKTPRTSNLQP